MLELSIDLYKRCRATLLECSEFDSDHSLRTVFVVAELRPYQDKLPSANNKVERVNLTMEYLLKIELKDGRSLFLLFLTALRDRYHVENALHDRLQALYEEIHSSVSTDTALPGVDINTLQRIRNQYPHPLAGTYVKVLGTLGQEGQTT
ncbi:hypothetical protein L0152_29815, partial [bacterium]|nr:hypothetical protein [bacterium]